MCRSLPTDIDKVTRKQNNVVSELEETNMKRSVIEDVVFPTCPVRNVLARLCDKWALLVLYQLDQSVYGSLRFTVLKKSIPDISQKMLVTTLRTLEEDGYVTRQLYPEVPLRVEYALTDRARALCPILNELHDWAVDNRDIIIRERKMAHAYARTVNPQVSDSQKKTIEPASPFALAKSRDRH